MAARPDKPVGVMLDTKGNAIIISSSTLLLPLLLPPLGPEIRTGVVDPSLGGKVKYVKDSIIEVGTDYTKYCTPEHLAISYPSLPKSVKVGAKMLVADGALMLEVTELKETSVLARVVNNASFGDKKNMNLPGAIVDLPTLTPKDIDDLQNFGVALGVDFIAASFVRKGEDIDFIREVLGDKGKNIKIIAKIENQEGLENYSKILDKTDGIMVARGDLGMEIPIEKVFLAQKMMITKANIAGKPVVTATQMLESMITNPRPTRAECADVANAVLDGTDAVMLSGETANGEYPNDAVRMMANTCLEAEAMIDFDANFEAIRHKVLATKSMSIAESVASSAVKSSWDIKAKLIVVLTESGTSARLVAKYRPSVPILALTADPQVMRICQGYYKNTMSKTVASLDDLEKSITEASEIAKKAGICKAGDLIVVVNGVDKKTGSTDTMRIVTCK